MLGVVRPTLSAQVSLAWDPPAGNTDGTPLDIPCVYTVYYGQASGNYTFTADAGTNAFCVVTNLPADGVHYFAVTARNVHGYESGFSNEVMWSPPPPPPAPVPPTVRQSSPATYDPGAVIEVSLIVSQTTALVEASLVMRVSEGAGIREVSGEGSPRIDEYGRIVWPDGPPAGAVSLTCRVEVPLSFTGRLDIRPELACRLQGESEIRRVAAEPEVLSLPVRDGDFDGLPDGWESAYGGPEGMDRDGDPDGDRLRTWQEWVAGTDPRDAGSVLRFVDLVLRVEGTTLVWPCVQDRRYRILKQNATSSGFHPLTDWMRFSSGQAVYFDEGPLTGGLYMVEVGALAPPVP